MRLDRLISVSLAHPFGRAARRLRTLGQPCFDANGSLPVLMYHSIADEPETGVSPYYRTSTHPASFRQQVGFLAEQGYRSLDFSAAVALSQQGKSVPQKSVVITFDDGFRNFRTKAFPVLEEYGFTATVFLPTGFIHNARQSFKGKECLTWDEVRELRRRGIHFGSHTVSHPQLDELSWKEIEHELSASKAEIERQLGEPVTSFAHPYAFPQTQAEYVRELTQLLARLRYTCCATTQIGRLERGSDPYRVKRLPVNSLDDSSLLRAKLEGGYDWLAVPQRLSRLGKSWQRRRHRRANGAQTSGVVRPTSQA
jgi:peptidoglycan/xylan/chitin deacetylase (PgdA/CDA1 family)